MHQFCRVVAKPKILNRDEFYQCVLIVILYYNEKRRLEMRICEEVRNTVKSDNDIIKREKIEDQILISFIL